MALGMGDNYIYQIIVKGVGKATQAITRIVRRTVHGFMGMSAAVLGVVAAIGLLMRVARKQTESEARLAGVIRATGQAAGYTFEEMQAMANAIQNVTLFADDAVMNLQAVLLTFREIAHEHIPAATQAVLDIASVMQTDLRSAAVMVGKALEDPKMGLSYLRRAGMSFNETEKEMIFTFQEFNRLGEAQALILHKIRDQVNETAQALAKTPVGRAQQFFNRLGDLVEKLSLELLVVLQPSLEILFKFLEKLFNFVNQKGPTIGNLMKYWFAEIHAVARHVAVVIEELIVKPLYLVITAVETIIDKLLLIIKNGIGQLMQLIGPWIPAFFGGGEKMRAAGLEMQLSTEGPLKDFSKIKEALGEFKGMGERIAASWEKVSAAIAATDAAVDELKEPIDPKAWSDLMAEFYAKVKQGREELDKQYKKLLEIKAALEAVAPAWEYIEKTIQRSKSDIEIVTEHMERLVVAYQGGIIGLEAFTTSMAFLMKNIEDIKAAAAELEGWSAWALSIVTNFTSAVSREVAALLDKSESKVEDFLKAIKKMLIESAILALLNQLLWGSPIGVAAATAGGLLSKVFGLGGDKDSAVGPPGTVPPGGAPIIIRNATPDTYIQIGRRVLTPDSRYVDDLTSNDLGATQYGYGYGGA